MRSRRVSLLRRLGDYAAHPDPLTAACNRIALLVASNQPLFPLYLWWIVGGDWWVSGWTFLSTPFFAAVPFVARRNARAGRMLLPLTGVANGIVSAQAFGTASGVELFLIPCALIAVLGVRRRDGVVAGLPVIAVAVAACLHGHYGAPWGRFTPAEYAHFRRLDIYSVAALSLASLWMLIRARRTTARR